MSMQITHRIPDIRHSNAHILRVYFKQTYKYKQYDLYAQTPRTDTDMKSLWKKVRGINYKKNTSKKMIAALTYKHTTNLSINCLFSTTISIA